MTEAQLGATLYQRKCDKSIYCRSCTKASKCWTDGRGMSYAVHHERNHMTLSETAPMTNVFGRPALYYPYIHIRSEHWLKATLLCVPTVKRIVPQNYVPEDDPQIVRYTEITGPHGALLQAVPAYSHAADRAQRHLLDK